MVIKNLKEYLNAVIFGMGLVSCSPVPEECRTYNETTTELPVQKTDGEIASFQELDNNPPEPRLVSVEMVDLINETHALGSAPLPEDLKVTQVELYCGHGDAYSILKNEQFDSYQQHRGIYVREPITLTGIGILNHEIGHFQLYGNSNEVIAELNELEQATTMVSLIRRKWELLNWAWIYSNAIAGSNLALNGFDNDSDMEHVEADILLHVLLQDHQGNHKTVRDLIGKWEEEGSLETTIRDNVQKFENNYHLDRYQGEELPRKADIILNSQQYTYLQLERLFGREVAEAYFTASGYFTYPFQRNPLFPFEREDDILTIGLEGYSCRIAEVTRGQPQNCEMNKECNDLGATHKVSVQANLCCHSLTNNSEFRRWIIAAEGDTYWHSDRRRLSVRGLVNWPYALEKLTIREIQELRPEEPCRSLGK